MPKTYKRNCDYCGKYYEGQGDRCCSLICWHRLEKGLNNKDKHEEKDYPMKCYFKMIIQELRIANLEDNEGEEWKYGN